MSLPGATIELVTIQTAGSVVLRKPSAVSNDFPQSHVVQEPMWPARPGAGQSVAGQCQHRAHDVVLRIPVAEPTPKQKREYGLHIALDQFRRGAVVVIV